MSESRHIWIRHVTYQRATSHTQHQEPLVVAVDRIDLSEIGGGHVGDVCYEAAVKRLTVKLLESVAEAQCSGAPVNMRLRSG